MSSPVRTKSISSSRNQPTGVTGKSRDPVTTCVFASRAPAPTATIDLNPRSSMKPSLATSLLAFCAFAVAGQRPAVTASETTPAAAPAAANPSGQSELETVLKRADDVLWFTRLADIAEVDKVAYASAPPAHAANPKAP